MYKCVRVSSNACLLRTFFICSLAYSLTQGGGARASADGCGIPSGTPAPFCLRSRPVTLDPAPFATPAVGPLARLARAPVHIPWNPCAPALTSGAHAPTFTFCRTALSAFCTGDLAWQIVAQDTSPRTSGSDTEGLMLKATSTAAYFGHGDGRDGGRMVCERGRSDERCVYSRVSQEREA